MIRDLEAQLLRIPDSTARAFMGEAVRCYHAGAYRASVVMGSAAGMNDLRAKLGELAASGGAPPALKISVSSIETRFKNQDVYEREAIAAAESDAQLITPAEAKSLRGVLDVRNLCAHPSGHQGSPEEARFVITTMIDVVMARPPVLGMVGVTQIMSRLGSSTFFPKSDKASRQATVAAELAAVHSSLFAAVVVKIVEVIEQEIAVTGATAANLSVLHNNALQFLKGMVSAAGEARDAVWGSKRFAGLVHVGADRLDVIVVLLADVTGLSAVDPLTRARILQILRSNLRTKPCRKVAAMAVSSGILVGSELDDLYNAAIGSMIGQWTDATPSEVTELGWARLENAFFDALVERCGSGTFVVANAAIDAVQGMAEDQAGRMGDARLAKYLVQVSRVGYGNYSARSAASLIASGLGARVAAVDALVRECERDASSVKEQRPSWEALGRLLSASKRRDAVVVLLSLFVNEPPSRRPLDLLNFVSEWPECREVMARFLQSDAATPVASSQNADSGEVG